MAASKPISDGIPEAQIATSPNRLPQIAKGALITGLALLAIAAGTAFLSVHFTPPSIHAHAFHMMKCTPYIAGASAVAFLTSVIAGIVLCCKKRNDARQVAPEDPGQGGGGGGDPGQIISTTPPAESAPVAPAAPAEAPSWHAHLNTARRKKNFLITLYNKLQAKHVDGAGGQSDGFGGFDLSTITFDLEGDDVTNINFKENTLIKGNSQGRRKELDAISFCSVMKELNVNDKVRGRFYDYLHGRNPASSQKRWISKAPTCAHLNQAEAKTQIEKFTFTVTAESSTVEKKDDLKNYFQALKGKVSSQSIVDHMRDLGIEEHVISSFFCDALNNASMTGTVHMRTVTLSTVNEEIETALFV